MEAYKKVTNVTKVPIVKSWNKGLLDPEDIQKYEDFLQSEEFLGSTDEEIHNMRRLPIPARTKPFFQNILRKGILAPTHSNNQGVDQVSYEYAWCLGPNYSLLKEDRPAAIALIEEYRVPINTTTITNMKISEIIKELEKHFGSNTIIMTADQYKNSGLVSIERKEIKQKMKIGESTQRIVYEGLIEVEDVSSLEVEPGKERSKTIKNYDDLSLNNLRKEVKQRGLRAMGSREQLIDLLIGNDRN